MSVFVDEIVRDLKEKPETFCVELGYWTGVYRDGFNLAYRTDGYDPKIKLFKDSKLLPVTYIDKFKLKRALKKWFNNATTEMLGKYR